MNIAIARRYAKALFELAQQEKLLNPVRERLEQMDTMIRSQSELLDLCQNPLYNQDDKKQILSSLSDRIGSPPLLKRFMDLLVHKNRLRQLPQIAKTFGLMVDEAHGLEHVRVRVANRLSKDQEAGLKRQLEMILQREVELGVDADPSLIGGMVVYAGGRVFDGSIKGRLVELRRELVK
jgi:F-type H+-transporting ATPase subunit delta